MQFFQLMLKNNQQICILYIRGLYDVILVSVFIRIGMIILLANMVMYFSASVVDLMMGLCVSALMVELIY